MAIIYGVMRAGKVDVVPGLFHVESSFAHVYFVPLIPTGGHLVLNPASGQAGELPTSVSFKSVLFAWMRTACVLTILGGMFKGVSEFDKKAFDPVVFGACLGVAGAALATLIASYWIRPLTTASYERAIELARQAGFNDMGMLTIEIAYGRMTAEQADAYLARLDEQKAPATD